MVVTGRFGVMTAQERMFCACFDACPLDVLSAWVLERDRGPDFAPQRAKSGRRLDGAQG